ncbi:GyrI-like domain-containing protein [Foetidibacter luteolus]|uniref:GyrI-like domain-containing protein n=1 Tax=Foetidibacter luteolus TaxID=2608880 RepID=UPI00129A1CBF|nr:GyrI-like domain-containing protein [Foetidibacter luteolus]
MKKWIAGILGVGVIAVVVCVYVFIPSEILVVEARNIKCSAPAVFRHISETKVWQEWLPGSSLVYNNCITHGNYTYNVSGKLYNAAPVIISTGSVKYSSSINILPLPDHTIKLQWKCSVKGSNNPFKRWSQFNEAKKLKKEFSKVFLSLQVFTENTKNVYGYTIEYTTLKDSTLAATKKITTNYPDTKTIYGMISLLETYAKANDAQITNHPMMNVRSSKQGYETIVAIPLNKELPGNATIFPSRLANIKDKTLILEVKGGQNEIQKAYKQLSIFMQDYQLTQPVIPFESLETNRSLQPDSSKWITRIYAPIV